MHIEMHLRAGKEERIKHLQLIQKLHAELLACKGVLFAPEHVNEYSV